VQAPPYVDISLLPRETRSTTKGTEQKQ